MHMQVSKRDIFWKEVAAFNQGLSQPRLMFDDEGF